MHVLASIAIVIFMCDIAVTAVALYLLPVLIGWLRRVPGLGAVVVVNVLLGWTIFGWACALAMALRSARPPAAAVQVVTNLHASFPRLAGGSRPDHSDLAPSRQGCPPPLQLPPRPPGPDVPI